MGPFSLHCSIVSQAVEKESKSGDTVTAQYCLQLALEHCTVQRALQWPKFCDTSSCTGRRKYKQVLISKKIPARFSAFYSCLTIAPTPAPLVANLCGECVSLSKSFTIKFSGKFPTPLERFPIERRKTKTKGITLTNHNRHKPHNVPIRTLGKCVAASDDWFWFYFWLFEKVVWIFLKPNTV